MIFISSVNQPKQYKM